MKLIQNTHIGAYGILIQDEKIALIRKARGGYKGKLDLPGGGIEHKESVVEALFREIQEEIGGTVTKYQLLDVVDTNITWQMEEDAVEDLHHIGILYIIEIKEANLKADSDGLDSNGANWYKMDSLKKEEVSPFTWMTLEKIKKR